MLGWWLLAGSSLWWRSCFLMIVFHTPEITLERESLHFLYASPPSNLLPSRHTETSPRIPRIYKPGFLLWLIGKSGSLTTTEVEDGWWTRPMEALWELSILQALESNILSAEVTLAGGLSELSHLRASQSESLFQGPRSCVSPPGSVMCRCRREDSGF